MNDIDKDYEQVSVTPSYFYSKKLIEDKINLIKDSIPSNKEQNVRIFFALKACYHKEVLDLLSKNKIGFETMTPFENEMLKKLNLDSNISSNGLGQRSFINESTFYTIDSYNDLLGLESHLVNNKIKNWGLRFRIQTSSSSEYSSLSSKLGLAHGDEDLKLILKFIKDKKLQPNLIHAHITINEQSTKPYIEALDGIKSLISKYDFKNIQHVNIGGGFATNFKKNQFEDIFQFFFKTFKNTNLLLEPGRFLVNNTCFGVATVLGVKKSQGINFIILDSGTNVLIPIPTAQYEVEFKNKSDGLLHCQFVDSILTASNIIGDTYKVNKLPVVGDKVLLKNVGAYTHSMASSWGYDIAPVSII